MPDDLALLRVELAHLRELMETYRTANQDALRLQAAEYERRLENLNGEAGRLREMQSSYVPREVYETAHQEVKDTANEAARNAASLGIEIRGNREHLARLDAGLVWLTRAVVTAILAGLVALAVQLFRR